MATILGQEYAIGKVIDLMKAKFNDRMATLDTSWGTLPNDRVFFGDRHIERDFPSMLVFGAEDVKIEDQFASVGFYGYLVVVEIYVTSERGDAEEAWKRVYRGVRVALEIVYENKRLLDESDRIFNTAHMNTQYATREQEKGVYVRFATILLQVQMNENF